jgi:glutathione S-transferase
MSSYHTLIADRLREQSERDAKGVADARKMLDVAYGWLEGELEPRAWACGSSFSLADCSAAPALFYADWLHPIGDRFPQVLAYRRRLLARPSVARVVDEARPYRRLFPQGAPDRD